MAATSSTVRRPSTIYGPVPSWRFGRSLGVDPILEPSTCSFNCIYCQLGSIQRVTAERRIFVPTDYVREDLRAVAWRGVDVVTLSGSGEPTLAANLGEIVATLRAATDRPIHLLTNATLFEDPEVRREVAAIDVISCKLDAPDDETLQRVNRPAPGIALERIVHGIELLRADHPGRLLLQVMLMPGNVERAADWAPLIERIRPDEVHLNTPRRPYPARWYLESRGDHASEHCRGKKTLPRTITREQALGVERLLRERTGATVLSVYRERTGA
jgi:wyosine [tRNA(Phe)-imidazoG37] synthetase (radical SAM superfamily)